MHKEFKVPLSEIAKQIGYKHQTVQRFYRALMVIEQAEKARVFARENRYKPHFSFSHLYTGLDYDGIAEFVQVKDVEDESTPRKHHEEKPPDHRPSAPAAHRSLGSPDSWRDLPDRIS